MWVWQCENLISEHHSMEWAIESMKIHRGEHNFTLPQHLHMRCDIPHEIRGVEAPCEWHEGCNIPFNPVVMPEQKSELKRLGFTLA